MRCPYCHQNIRVQGRFCPKCGQQIFGLPVQPQTPPTAAPGPRSPLPPAPQQPVGPPPVTPPPVRPPDLSSDGIELDVEPGPAAPTPWAPPAQTGAHPAAGEEIGKTCPYCRFPVKPGEQVYVCPACKVVHHQDCWRENQGCTTYGCRGGAVATPAPAQPAYRPPGAYTSHPTGGVVPDFGSLQAREMDGRANNALWMALAGWFCCPPLTLVGLFMALSLLGEIGRAGAGGGRARGKVIAAIIVAVAAVLTWVIYLVIQSRMSYG